METAYPLRELERGCARVPALPGVYVFRSADQRALYVGKSRNLRARLASYFRPGAREARKVRSLRQFADAVHIERTGSEFAALLREVELVQALSPPYNRRLRHPERYAYVGVDYRECFPRLTVTCTPWDGGQFLGPFCSTRRVSEAIEVIADAFHLRTCAGDIVPTLGAAACWRHQVRSCSAPCIGAVSAGSYGRDFLQALQALTGRSRAVLAALAEERDRLAAGERFEDAGRRQRRIAAIERVRRLLFINSQRVWHDALVVQPGAEPHTVQLWAIAAGRVCTQARCARGSLSKAFAQVWDAVQRAAPPAGTIPQRELDARWIVHRWLHSPTGQRWSIALRQQRREAVWEKAQALADAAVAGLFPELGLGWQSETANRRP